MALFKFTCGACKRTGKHFIPHGSSRVPKCVCGEVKMYCKVLGTVTSEVNHTSVAEIMEHNIDPVVSEYMETMGREFINGDVKTMENLFGEERVKSTFHEEDGWSDE